MKEIIKCFNNYYIQSLQKLQQPVILNLTKRWQHSHSISLNQPLGDLAQFKSLDGFCLSAVDQSHLLAVCETAWIWITQSRTWAPNPTEQNSRTAAQVTIVIVHLICFNLSMIISYMLQMKTLVPIVTHRLFLVLLGPLALLVHQVR